MFMGSGITNSADELLHYGADKVFVYDDEKLKNCLLYTSTIILNFRFATATICAKSKSVSTNILPRRKTIFRAKIMNLSGAEQTRTKAQFRKTEQNFPHIIWWTIF